MTDLKGPIGVFDSGYGGLTILRSITEHLPQYDYLYLGDNARAPYGSRSYETIYGYTLECVKWFFAKGCPLVILACNTASAKALRTIQQKDLPGLAKDNRVLGVIRPTTEIIGNLTTTGSIGILGTKGTIASGSYPIELQRFFPSIKVYQHACPLWVPMIENDEYLNEGADHFIEKDIKALLQQDTQIDTILLACTHYPLLLNTIRKFIPPSVQVITQGEIVAESLKRYLEVHGEIANRCMQSGKREFFTTDDPSDFDLHSTSFFGKEVKSKHLQL